jgi:hypothetical protein
MFGYWVYSVTVDEVDQLDLSGKIMTDSGQICWPTQGVYKVKFPVTGRARKSVPTTMDLTNFYSWKLRHNRAQTARKVR